MIHENHYKFLKPPTIEQIEIAVKAMGVSEAQFERYHGLFNGAIRQHRHGHRTIPAKHWHLFLEDMKPVPTSVPKLVSKSVSTNRASNPRPKKDSRINNLL